MSGILQTSIGSFGGSGNPEGQQEYTSPGTYSWTAPAHVEQVCVVAVGAGNYSGSPYAGGGGGLGWKNNITVVPGNSYTVEVGNWADGAAAGNSYFINDTTVKGGGAGYGGTGAQFYRNGGTYVGAGGGNGGMGGHSPGWWSWWIQRHRRRGRN